MARSRALKEEMPMMREETPESMMEEAKDMARGANNSMMRANVMRVGAQAMMGKKRPKKQEDDMMKYSDLGGLNFNPKKFKMQKKKK